MTYKFTTDKVGKVILKNFKDKAKLSRFTVSALFAAHFL